MSLSSSTSQLIGGGGAHGSAEDIKNFFLTITSAYFQMLYHIV